LSIDGLDLGQVPAICRDATPSLIGARLLEHFIVTLDMPKQSAYFYEFTRPACSQPSFGLTFAFNDEITVAMVWDDSAAAKAGIRPGLKLMSINGNKTQMTSQGIQAALEALKNEKIHLEWEGGSATLIEKICVTDDKSTPTHDLFPKRLF
jgi:predicted metalloprotease with PDZ domain